MKRVGDKIGSNKETAINFEEVSTHNYSPSKIAPVRLLDLTSYIPQTTDKTGPISTRFNPVKTKNERCFS